MRAFSYAWSLLVICGKDGGHNVQSAVAKNPMLHANFVALGFIGPWSYWLVEILHCVIRDYWTIFAPVILTLTRWPTCTNLTRIPSRYTGCAKMNFVRQGCRKLSYFIQADIQTPPKLIPRRGRSIIIYFGPLLRQLVHGWHKRLAGANYHHYRGHQGNNILVPTPPWLLSSRTP